MFLVQHLIIIYQVYSIKKIQMIVQSPIWCFQDKTSFKSFYENYIQYWPWRSNIKELLYTTVIKSFLLDKK